MRERLLPAALLIAYFVAGYFGIGYALDPQRARELTSPFDEQIPFVAHAVWLYLCAIPVMLSPLFVRDRAIFRRTVLAYALVITVSLTCFVAFPVTSQSLRMPLTELDLTRMSDRAVALLYAVDPPLNLLPSLHVSLVVLATIAIWRDGRLGTVPAAAAVLFIAASVCLIKQHYAVDAIAGAVLGLLMSTLIRPLRPARATESAPRGS